ncbi:MAG: hypothetical protein IKC64_05895 [Clostridia bacterium]|nr:hypothetical protein [Clostridia bacterium]
MDFDKLFEEFLTDWLEEHKQEYTPDEVEYMLPELYDKWLTTPSKALGGISPEGYYANKTDPKELVDEFIAMNEGDNNPSSLLIDHIVEVEGCEKYLVDIIENHTDPKTVIGAMNILQEMGAKPSVDRYLFFITTDGVDEGVSELASEVLKEMASEVRDRIFELLPTATLEVKEIFAEILVETEHDDRIFDLLKELFVTSDNTPFIAGLIARYGDERSVSYLYPALDDCNYLEFIEIRNAIESLGGVVDDEYRDFSDDEYYKAMKNLR